MVVDSFAGASKKRILVPLYSQSGQLIQITKQILAPLHESSGIEITYLPLVPVRPYPFPWTFFRFLDAFPESAHQVAPPLETLGLRETDQFDLIVLPYQVWFLAPSLPIQALLQDPVFRLIARGKPVITVIACRNMWHMAQEKVKTSLQQMGARLLDNVVLTDQGGTFATFITVPRWLLSGKSNAFWGLPPAGVHPTEIARSRRFGLALKEALLQNLEQKDEALLSGLEAVKAQPTLLISERAGTRSFAIWGKLVRLMGEPGVLARLPILVLYIVFLLCLIITVVPMSLLLQFLLKPLLRKKLAREKRYFEAPSGSGNERLGLYE